MSPKYWWHRYNIDITTYWLLYRWVPLKYLRNKFCQYQLNSCFLYSGVPALTVTALMAE